MVKAIYAGSFDPITKGHLHLIQRATVLFDEVIVLISHNHRLDENIETVLLISEPAYEYVSSTMVKELAKFGGEFESFVPESVAEILEKRYAGQECQQMTLQERSE